MQSPRVRRRIISRTIGITLLAVAAGCSQSDSPQTDQSTPSAIALPDLSQAASASASSPSDPFPEAMDTAMSAATVTQSAISPDDWNLVASQWQRAIALLQSVPSSHPKKQLASQKIAEYQRNLAYAQQQAARSTQAQPSRTSSVPSLPTPTPTPIPTPQPPPVTSSQATTPSVPSADCNFLIMGGGSAPSSNEIALEKNVLYFQRTLQTLGYNPASASIFFANGNDGQATIRYLDQQRNEQFKVPEIPYLKGSATLENFQNWIQQTASQATKRPIFFYFTGHGEKNNQNVNNNSLLLWQGKHLTVRQLSQQLDQLPQDMPVVTMMAQCYAGSFANFIYQGGDPTQPVALQTRCGFFATVSTRTSVGCTPEVNEADYKDYSSSFFAGLSGRSRTGETVPSADYNQDGRVSYAEAHAFAKIDEQTTDWPISTSEAWLQKQASEKDLNLLLSQPIIQILQTARPEQRYVVESIAQMFNINLEKSLLENGQTLREANVSTDEQIAYLVRLRMELINISMEKTIRAEANPGKVAILNRLIQCESGSWGRV